MVHVLVLLAAIALVIVLIWRLIRSAIESAIKRQGLSRKTVEAATAAPPAAPDQR